MGFGKTEWKSESGVGAHSRAPPDDSHACMLASAGPEHIRSIGSRGSGSEGYYLEIPGSIPVPPLWLDGASRKGGTCAKQSFDVGTGRQTPSLLLVSCQRDRARFDHFPLREKDLLFKFVMTSHLCRGRWQLSSGRLPGQSKKEKSGLSWLARKLNSSSIVSCTKKAIKVRRLI